MGRRVYTSGVNSASIGTPVQDIWTVLAGASNGIQLHWVQLSAVSVATAIQNGIRLKRGTGVGLGSGGSQPAKNLVDDGDTKASGSTVHANDTAQASGTFTSLTKYWFWNLLLPFDYMPGPEDEDRDTCSVSEALIVDLPGVTPGPQTIDQNITWREYP
jgi:hypothetical protein